MSRDIQCWNNSVKMGCDTDDSLSTAVRRSSSTPMLGMGKDFEGSECGSALGVMSIAGTGLDDRLAVLESAFQGQRSQRHRRATSSTALSRCDTAWSSRSSLLSRCSTAASRGATPKLGATGFLRPSSRPRLCAATLAPLGCRTPLGHGPSLPAGRGHEILSHIPE